MKSYHSRLLTDPDVRDIKRALWFGAISSTLASEHGVSEGMIRHIRNGLYWKHVPWPEIDPRTREPLTGSMPGARMLKIRRERAAASKATHVATKNEIERLVKRRLKRGA